MTHSTSSKERSATVSMGRQPIYDGKKHLWGYVLFCVDNTDQNNLGAPTDACHIALHVASSTYIGLQQFLQQEKKLLVPITEKHLLDELPYAFPPHLAAISISESIFDKPHIMNTVTTLHNDGYFIVIEDFSGSNEAKIIYDQADIFCIDISKHSLKDIQRLTGLADAFDLLLIAKNIETPDKFQSCHDLGFSLFHGSFFKAPELFTDQQVSSTDISRFNLLTIIEKQDPDMDHLSNIIQADVSISFRLLSYLNSAAFGFSQNITSIHKAITLVGWKQLKKWLRVIVLSDMAKNKQADDLIFLSAQRGKFLETIATENDYWGFDPDSLFLLGTFSLLDTLIGMPMNQIITHLPVDNKIKGALCKESNNEYIPLIQLATYLEEARWNESHLLMQNLNLNPIKVKTAFQASVDWANELSTFQF